MPTIYAYRFFIFIEADKVNTANNLAAQWDPDSGGDQTFGSVRLSANGQEPATYIGAATYATATMRDGITQAFSNLSWAHLFTDPPYSWESALEAMGLQRIGW